MATVMMQIRECTATKTDGILPKRMKRVIIALQESMVVEEQDVGRPMNVPPAQLARMLRLKAALHVHHAQAAHINNTGVAVVGARQGHAQTVMSARIRFRLDVAGLQRENVEIVLPDNI